MTFTECGRAYANEERRFTSELQKWAEQQQEAEIGEGQATPSHAQPCQAQGIRCPSNSGDLGCLEMCGVTLGETYGICTVVIFSYGLLGYLPCAKSEAVSVGIHRAWEVSFLDYWAMMDHDGP